jgi:hypothetical protein
MTDELQQAIDWLNTKAPKANIKGRDYTQVATRVEAFRRFFGTHYGITTELMPSDAGNLVRVRATITNADGAVLATGMAEEDRNVGNINKTSALENCETSAIGRALAAFGLHGGEFATANEVEGARHQEQAAQQQPAKTYNGTAKRGEKQPTQSEPAPTANAADYASPNVAASEHPDDSALVLEVFRLCVDSAPDTDTLKAWWDEHQHAYEVLTGEDKKRVNAMFKKRKQALTQAEKEAA